MSEAKTYIQALFHKYGIPVHATRAALFEKFAAEEANRQAVTQIAEIQKMLMDTWRLRSRIADILQQPVSIPNGTVGKPYTARIDFAALGWSDLADWKVGGLDETGLQFSNEEKTITGVPVISGDLHITLQFRLDSEAETETPHEKKIPLIINPDPKSLWKTKDSDPDAPYQKDTQVAASGTLGDRHFVVASKRGRSHANAGTFRDDDFTIRQFDNGWSLIAVADGAGSAPLSRKGSALACAAVAGYFSEQFTEPVLQEFDAILEQHHLHSGQEETQKKLSHFVYNHLSKAAWSAHQSINDFAAGINAAPKDFHTTLVFVLFKKYSFGTAFLSFGVGDCPAAILSRDLSEVTLMNWLDVGEFSGGTRFITMPDIFSSDKFATRFRFRLMDDFSYLVLMTDGIYDPKFVVESNLEKTEKWTEFLDDLQGANEEGITVSFDPANPDIAGQLSAWMDFWSPGNHDDRTLAIVY